MCASISFNKINETYSRASFKLSYITKIRKKRVKNVWKIPKWS